MVEVFKTNVSTLGQANRVIDLIHGNFAGYEANFDLEDRDKILRVECATGVVHAATFIHFLKDIGFQAEVLADEYPVVEEVAK